MYFGNKQRQYIYFFISDEKRSTIYIFIYLSVSGKVSDGNKRKKYVIVFFKYGKKERISETDHSSLIYEEKRNVFVFFK